MTRKEAIGRLFRQFPKEATPARLNQMLEDTSGPELDDLVAACDRLVRTWREKKAPIAGDVNAAARQIAGERAERERALEPRPLPGREEVVGVKVDLLDYVARIRAVRAAGVCVPPRGTLGRTLATMYVHHERGIGWNEEPDGDYLRALEGALIELERNHDSADVNWWSDWKEARGWA